MNRTTIKLTRDSKWQISYVMPEGQESAFRVSPELADLIVAAPDLLDAVDMAINALGVVAATMAPDNYAKEALDLCTHAYAKAMGDDS